jgi:hypothetical protein
MLTRSALLVPLAALTLSVVAAACASSAVDATAGGEGGNAGTTTTTTTAQTTGSGGAGGAGGATAAGGSGGATGVGGSGGFPGCQNGEEAVFAVDHLFVGDTDTDFKQDPLAWKQFGLNLDGKVSTKDSADLCKPWEGASKTTVYPDGDNGIDNAFGKNVLPIMLGLNADFASQVNTSIEGGLFSILLALEGLAPGNDQAPIAARVYSGSSTETPPAFDGTDCWPVTAESLTDTNDVASARVVFPKSQLVDSTWQSNGEATMDLTIPSFPDPIHLRIHHARMSMNLVTDHQTAIAGQVGGVLDTEEFITEVTRLVGIFDPTLCGSVTLDNILNQIRKASDIGKDGSQDPNATCDGISIGLGFTMARVGLGDVAAPIEPKPSPCE